MTVLTEIHYCSVSGTDGSLAGTILTKVTISVLKPPKLVVTKTYIK